MTEAKINGKLIKIASEHIGGFMFTPELWEWIYVTFPQYARKEVVISIKEVDNAGR